MSLVRTNSRNSGSPLSPNWRLHAPVTRIVPLPQSPGLSIVIPKDNANWAKVETSVAVIVPFESPAGASVDELVALVAADEARVNAIILSRTCPELATVPAFAHHAVSRDSQ